MIRKNITLNDLQNDLHEVLRFLQDNMVTRTEFHVLENRFDNLENKFGNLENRFGNLENRFDIQDYRTTSLESRLNNIDHTLTTMNNKFTAMFDGFVQSQQKFDLELLALTNKTNRHDDRLTSIEHHLNILPA
jgi:DNA repair ATPase RecN